MLNKNNKENEDLKEARKMLDELKEMIDLLGETDIDKKRGIVANKLEEASKQKAKLSIELNGKGGAQCEVEGHRLSLLLALASLEKHVLKETETPQRFFEAIKNVVGTEEDIEVL